MALSLVKTTAIAAALVIATASSSFAATWGMVNQDTVVRGDHYNGAPIVNYVEEGEVVKVISSWGKWYKIDIDGPNGWVRKFKISFDYDDDPSDPDFKFCFYGPLGYVCAKS